MLERRVGIHTPQQIKAQNDRVLLVFYGTTERKFDSTEWRRNGPGNQYLVPTIRGGRWLIG
jgi:hypothetical protein